MELQQKTIVSQVGDNLVKGKWALVVQMHNYVAMRGGISREKY